MNERINGLWWKARIGYNNQNCDPEVLEKFAELIVEECRTVVTEVYRNTPLELCGPLLTADEKIAEHFYRVKE
jgi:hypothetical protein